MINLLKEENGSGKGGHMYGCIIYVVVTQVSDVKEIEKRRESLSGLGSNGKRQRGRVDGWLIVQLP